MSDHESRYASAPPPSSQESEDGDEHMISPQCVMDEGRQAHQQMEEQKQRLKENPDLMDSMGMPDVLGKHSAHGDSATAVTMEISSTEFNFNDSAENVAAVTKTVRFSPLVIERDPSIVWDLEDMGAMWWTQEEIQSFSRTARSKAHAFLRKNESFTRTFHSVFQDCSKEASSRRLLQTQSVQELLSSANALRGLESRTISVIRQYRNFHITSVLEAAEKQDVAELLRARSLRTSKPSRALARILARQDSMAIAHMIRKELAGEPPSPCSSADTSGEPLTSGSSSATQPEAVDDDMKPASR
ncbi:MAG: hypothetical protein SGILL_004933 [Bacillariaceae sp.]